MSSIIKKQQLTRWLKQRIKEDGFLDVKIAKAEFMEEEARRLELWLSQNRQGQMSYLENHFDKRVDPRKLLPGAKSVIIMAYNYYPELYHQNKPKIARYALGRDYHKVLKKKLKAIYSELQEQMPDISGRFFVDSAPVLERDWARRAGLGWIGKNTMLIHRYHGSYFFLADMILNVELEYDPPIDDFCGTCRKCIDACPTKAIDDQGYLMDGSKCISYLTIELKEDIPLEFKGKMSDWVFGCDICQEVCPWNRFSNPHNEEAFVPKEELQNMTMVDWDTMSEDDFNRLFQGSAVKRTGFRGIKRNLKFLNE